MVGECDERATVSVVATERLHDNAFYWQMARVAGRIAKEEELIRALQVRDVAFSLQPFCHRSACATRTALQRALRAWFHSHSVHRDRSFSSPPVLAQERWRSAARAKTFEYRKLPTSSTTPPCLVAPPFANDLNHTTRGIQS